MAADVAALLAAQRALDPLVIDLARALSLAARIETPLVRHMRLELFPDSDAGLEANLWFSTLVADRDMLGVALIPECRDELRRQLTLPEHRQTLDQAWRVIVSCHQPADAAGVPPVITLQEATTYHALAAAAYGSATHRQSMQEGLGTLMKGLSEDSDGTLTQWIIRSLPALPPTARQSAAAIALAERVRERDATAVLEGVPRVARDASGRPLIDWALNTVAVGVRRRTDGIELTVPPAVGAHAFQIPNTSPLAVGIQSPTPEGWHTRSVDFEPVPRQVIPDPTPASVCRFMTASGQRLTVQPMFGETAATLDVWTEGVDVDPSSLNHIPEELNTRCADLGWNLRWPAADLPSTGDPPSALLYLGEASALIAPSPIVPVIAWARDRLEPVDGGAALTLTLEHDSTVLSAEFSPDATRIATGGDGSIRLWDAGTGDLLQEQPLQVPSRAASFSPDGKRLLLASNDGTVSMWPLDRPEPSSFGTHEDWVMSAEFGASGTIAVTASQDSTAAIWDVESRARRVVLRHQAAVNHASFSPDELRVATASDDQTASVWSLDGRKLATLTHDADVRSVQWSPDGQWLLTADAGGNAWLWSASTFARDQRPFQHDFEIQFAAFSSDGRRIAVATGDGIAWVWHVPSRVLLVPGLQAPSLTVQSNIPIRPSKRPRPRRLQAVYSVAFAPDGQRLLTGGASGRAHVWDLSTAAASNPVARRETQRRMEFAPPVPEILKGVKELLRAQLLALDERRLLSWTAHSPSPEEAAAHEPNPAPERPPTEDTTAAQPSRPTIFVSYSHEDKQWRERLQRILHPLLRSQDIHLWTDSQIAGGETWDTEIDAAIARAKVAIILVTPSYLASDFALRELKRLADAAIAGRLKILWVAVEPCDWSGTPLAEYQAVNDPSRPLSTLNRTAQEQAFIAIAERVREAFEATADDAQTAGARSRIFLCYRRGSEGGRAGRLSDRLTNEFGESEVFRDVSSIPAGVDFTEIITDAVTAAAVMLVVIGPQWLEERDADGRRRIDSEQDWMRLEVAQALNMTVRVIPVLVGGARMPSQRALPPNLGGLAQRQAITLSDDRWEHDVAQLIDLLRPLVGDTVSGGSEPAATPRLPVQIFLSSTHADLKEHRERVVGALSRLSEFKVVNNEPTIADESGPVQREIEELASADLMILIVALRYGYVPDDKALNPEGLSITELAFNQALRLNKPVLAFLADPDRWHIIGTDAATGEGDGGRRITEFRKRLTELEWVGTFAEPADLAERVVSALLNWRSQAERLFRAKP